MILPSRAEFFEVPEFLYRNNLGPENEEVTIQEKSLKHPHNSFHFLRGCQHDRSFQKFVFRQAFMNRLAWS